jgi:hypothetical protein
MLAPLAQELPVGRKDLNAMIDLIGDVHLAVLGDGDTARSLECAIAFAGLAPLPKELFPDSEQKFCPPKEIAGNNCASV